MAGYHDDSPAPGGLLGYSLKLAAAVIATGLAVMVLVDREGTSAPAPATTLPLAEQPAPVQAPLSELVLRAGAHGHFMVEAMVNGTPITFLVDTGASSIYLTPDDAARLGWTPPRLTYSERYNTAAGVVYAAPVTLRSLRVGQLELYDLPASVGQQPSGISLLGMSFLKRLASYEMRGDRLILSW
jgi:aspartyl protease family protein